MAGRSAKLPRSTPTEHRSAPPRSTPPAGCAPPFPVPSSPPWSTTASIPTPATASTTSPSQSRLTNKTTGTATSSLLPHPCSPARHTPNSPSKASTMRPRCGSTASCWAQSRARSVAAALTSPPCSSPASPTSLPCASHRRRTLESRRSSPSSAGLARTAAPWSSTAPHFSPPRVGTGFPRCVIATAASGSPSSCASHAL